MNVLHRLTILSVVLLLAACAAPPEQPQMTARTSTLSPRLPRGIVRTNGHGEIMAAAAGQAALTALETRAGVHKA